MFWFVSLNAPWTLAVIPVFDFFFFLTLRHTRKESAAFLDCYRPCCCFQLFSLLSPSVRLFPTTRLSTFSSPSSSFPSSDSSSTAEALTNAAARCRRTWQGAEGLPPPPQHCTCPQTRFLFSLLVCPAALQEVLLIYLLKDFGPVNRIGLPQGFSQVQLSHKLNTVQNMHIIKKKKK